MVPQSAVWSVNPVKHMARPTFEQSLAHNALRERASRPMPKKHPIESDSGFMLRLREFVQDKKRYQSLLRKGLQGQNDRLERKIERTKEQIEKLRKGVE